MITVTMSSFEKWAPQGFGISLPFRCFRECRNAQDASSNTQAVSSSHCIRLNLGEKLVTGENSQKATDCIYTEREQNNLQRLQIHDTVSFYDFPFQLHESLAKSRITNAYDSWKHSSNYNQSKEGGDLLGHPREEQQKKKTNGYKYSSVDRYDLGCTSP